MFVEADTQIDMQTHTPPRNTSPRYITWYRNKVMEQSIENNRICDLNIKKKNT